MDNVDELENINAPIESKYNKIKFNKLPDNRIMTQKILTENEPIKENNAVALDLKQNNFLDTTNDLIAQL